MDKKNITKIVITGGPCAGKTTAMSRIREKFTDMGYVVIFVPETSTELISNGIAPWTLYNNSKYQEVLINLQIEKEKIFEKAAKESKGGDKVLIVCDRGVLDSKAYISDDGFKQILKRCGLDEITLRDGYEAVFHLVTAAKGAEEFYTLANNSARTETAEKAIELDEKTMHAWIGHPHLRVIDNSTNFEEKLKKLIEEISAFLGEPKPYEIERKFLIEYPDIKMLSSSDFVKKTEIIQTYLVSHGGDEVRLRQSGLNGHFTYTITTKKKISGVKRIEIEKRITKDEYVNLLLRADTSKKQIRKTRYRFMYDNQYFEVDIYPFWKDKAIMEIELKDENQKIQIPNFISVIKEVTEDDNYKNSSLANVK
ncbi:MAG: AAA family ATPase [Clostridia bacterium]|nr:AAA family ATPase [Clostridia bacterium]